MSMEEARKPENLPKNRYRDILPCKLTNASFRIILCGNTICSYNNKLIGINVMITDRHTRKEEIQ